MDIMDIIRDIKPSITNHNVTAESIIEEIENFIEHNPINANLSNSAIEEKAQHIRKLRLLFRSKFRNSAKYDSTIQTIKTYTMAAANQVSQNHIREEAQHSKFIQQTFISDVSDVSSLLDELIKTPTNTRPEVNSDLSDKIFDRISKLVLQCPPECFAALESLKKRYSLIHGFQLQTDSCALLDTPDQPDSNPIIMEKEVRINSSPKPTYQTEKPDLIETITKPTVQAEEPQVGKSSVSEFTKSPSEQNSTKSELTNICSVVSSNVSKRSNTHQLQSKVIVIVSKISTTSSKLHFPSRPKSRIRFFNFTEFSSHQLVLSVHVLLNRFQMLMTHLLGMLYLVLLLVNCLSISTFQLSKRLNNHLS